ncbi:E2IG2 protein [Loa loa]|uniref:E2IG2 protein n=1 Tax=Loa loa TaxID=7209 RepID=A0A1I7VRI0_LOALO|nr:E2IG2 protein [Loa loa]EFO22628.1 E2IG2 protein [Loa loa]
MEKDQPEEEYDYLERAIRKTGCWEEHLACAECMGDTRDWRACKEELQKFRDCMQNYMKDKVVPSGKASN